MCVRERDRERKKERERECVCVCANMFASCVSLSVWVCLGGSVCVSLSVRVCLCESAFVGLSVCPPHCACKVMSNIMNNSMKAIPAIAQLVEHLTVDLCSYQMVPGSIPGGRIATRNAVCLRA